MRSGEGNNLKLTDIDFERGAVRITPEKHSKPRIIRISAKSMAMIQNLPKTSEKVFGDSTANTKRNCLIHTRKVLARKLNNPRLLQIHFHTLRHWKATMLYHQTKDILHVKEFLGHRRIDNTLKYVQLEQVLFDKDADSFTCRVAETPEQIRQLIEAGFEHVTERDNLVYFRKRK